LMVVGLNETFRLVAGLFDREGFVPSEVLGRSLLKVDNVGILFLDIGHANTDICTVMDQTQRCKVCVLHMMDSVVFFIIASM
jgi:hypothetical protein